MVNVVMLIGRLVRDPEIVECENGKKISRITLAVNRKFKSSDGIYHTDFIDCVLWNNFAVNVNEYCKKGDLIGVRGRIQIESFEKDDGTKRKTIDVVVESLTFLTTAKNKEQLIELEAGC